MSNHTDFPCVWEGHNLVISLNFLSLSLSLSLSLFFSIGADATGGGSEEDRQDVGQHGSGSEDQPEAHYQYQKCVGWSCQLLQGQARDKTTTWAAKLIRGQWQVRFTMVKLFIQFIDSNITLKTTSAYKPWTKIITDTAIFYLDLCMSRLRCNCTLPTEV